MQQVIYRRRRGAISRGEREWRVEEDALVSRGGSGRERRYPWKDMVGVRLCHEPARFRPWRYVVELQRRQGRKIEIDNAHYAGGATFEDRSESFRLFALAAIGHVAVANPKARALMGETPRRYFFFLLLALLGLGTFAFLLIALRTPLDDLPYAPLIKLGLVLAMLPIFWGWVIRAMPRGVPLDAIPARALPPSERG
jgi:hypothetical protein